MRIKVDVILGFLGSGKTSLLNDFLNSGEIKEENIVIVQFENGNSKVSINSNVSIVKRNIKEGIDDLFLKSIYKDYMPDRIIIEYNGMGDTDEFLKFTESKYFNKLFILRRVIDVIDANKFNLYIINMRDRFLSHIINSNVVIINNCASHKESEVKEIEAFVKHNNYNIKAFKFKERKDAEKAVLKRKLCLNSINEKVSFKEIISTLLTVCFLLGILCFCVFLNFTGKTNNYISLFNKFKTSFIAITLESFPFILIGSFIAAIIQIFIPDTWIYKILRRNKLVSSISGALLGVVFPICDCGTIPLAFGLLNKQVPLNAVVAFMLASPIVNPISIISTMYAFSDNKSMMFYRVGIGVFVAIVVSLILSSYKREDIVLNNYSAVCDCSLCSEEFKNLEFREKLKGVFIGTGDEFIRVSKYMIIAAILGSIFQLIDASTLAESLKEGKITYILFMMALAFLLSLCSTSDAFVAKGFMNIVPYSSVLGFLVFGPMIDMKNVIMLTGYFKKNFIVKYVASVFIVSLIILLLIPV